MGWGLTSISSDNTIIEDIRVVRKYSFTFNAGWILQYREETTTTYSYVGINADSASSLVVGLLSDSSTIDAFFQNGEAGGCGTIKHVVQTYGAYTTP